MAQVAKKRRAPSRNIWILDGVSWQQYSRFLRAFQDRPGFRLTYDEGTLEIMSPTIRHDRPGRFLSQLVWALADELDLPTVAGGSATLRRRLKKRGAEPDECYWIENAHRMLDVLDLDLRRDPPPDLAIEVDVTSSSLNRMAIYESLRVPELWRLEGDALQFFLLGGNGRYKQADHSKVFPKITPEDLMRFVSRGRRETNQIRILRDFRKWVRSLE